MHLEQLASIVPADQITRTSEKVALKKGLQLHVFTSMTEAIRWLSGSGTDPATGTPGGGGPGTSSGTAPAQ